MRNYFLYYHGGSCNHGCEALVRTTVELLDYKKNNISLASFRPEEDRKYGLEALCKIHKMFESKSVSRCNPRWIYAYVNMKLKHNVNAIDDLFMLNALGAIKGDIAISIGGDNYCYGYCDELFRIDNVFRRNQVKTVLWGCSIEPELLEDSTIYNDILRFDLITARESISYEAIKKVNPNTILVNDSAFLLDTVKKPLPKGLTNGDIVGINLSPMAESFEKKNGIARKCFQSLIEYILQETNMKVLLIPHVVWNNNDDRAINEFFFEKFKSTNRVFKVEDANCKELKGYISQCRFFVGARTHATIAAYSNMIPTLVLGYSVKSRGIARDLFGDESHYVLPVQKIKESGEIVEAFKWIVQNESYIRNHLNIIIPEYKTRINKAVEIIEDL